MSADGIFELEETRFGFRWGAMNVERIASDPKFGTVVGIFGKPGVPAVYVRVSPAGRVVELEPQE